LLRSDAAAVAAAKAMDLRGYGRNLVQALRARAVWSLCLMAGFRTAMQNGLLLFLPLYLANELNVNPFWMGVVLMALQLGGVVAAPIAGILSDRIGRRPVVLSGMVVSTVLVIGLTLVSDPLVFVACISVLGFFMYALRPVIHSWLMDRSPPRLAATMTSAMFGTQAGFSAMIPVIGGIIADAYGLGAVFYLLAASMLIANLLVYAIPKTESGD
jgi:MFS family permease